MIGILHRSLLCSCICRGFEHRELVVICTMNQRKCTEPCELRVSHGSLRRVENVTLSFVYAAASLQSPQPDSGTGNRDASPISLNTKRNGLGFKSVLGRIPSWQ